MIAAQDVEGSGRRRQAVTVAARWGRAGGGGRQIDPVGRIRVEAEEVVVEEACSIEQEHTIQRSAGAMRMLPHTGPFAADSFAAYSDWYAPTHLLQAGARNLSALSMCSSLLGCIAHPLTPSLISIQNCSDLLALIARSLDSSLPWRRQSTYRPSPHPSVILSRRKHPPSASATLAAGETCPPTPVIMMRLTPSQSPPTRVGSLPCTGMHPTRDLGPVAAVDVEAPACRDKPVPLPGRRGRAGGDGGEVGPAQAREV
jgi:hypothetical protein